MLHRYTRHRRFRKVRAAFRDAYLILRESGPWLVAFAGVWIAFGLIIWRYDQREVGASIVDALYVAFAQMLFQLQPLPRAGWLQALFFLAPAVGLLLIARGAFNAGLLIFDKRNRREAWQMALASTYREHIIVCGLGRMGYRVVGQLLATGHDVVGVDRDKDGEYVVQLIAEGVPVIVGDGRRIETLQAARLDHARAVVSVIDDDLTNLDIGLTARQHFPDVRIVLRVFSDILAQKLQSAFNIKTAFSISALAAPTFAAAALNRDVTNALYVGGKFLTTQEVVVAQNGALDGRLVGTIEQEHDISVLYRRNERGEDLRPRGDYRLGSGDTIVIIGTLGSLEQIAALNQPGARPHVPEAMRGTRG
jgi:voltage-gated potassium channel